MKHGEVCVPLDPCPTLVLHTHVCRMAAADDAKHLRNLVRQMALDTLPEGEREQGRIEVLPVQWRKHLNLGVRKHLSSARDNASGYEVCTDFRYSRQTVTLSHVRLATRSAARMGPVAFGGPAAPL